jgi:hypothetical protein
MTQELVQKLFSYDPATGVMRRLMTVSSRAMRGQRVGCENEAGYLVVRFDGKLHYVHRLIWLHVHGYWPLDTIDHINGNRRDNRLSNLRHVTHSVNSHNTEIASGVYWAHRDRVWIASIQVNGVKKHLGQHKNRAVAELIYRIAKQKQLP